MSFSGKTQALRSIARERGKRLCDLCREWCYVDGDAAELERHRAQCLGRLRYRCPVHGWRVLSELRILREHIQCDPTLNFERIRRLKPVKRKESVKP